MEDLSTHLLQAAGVSGLPKVPEEPSAVRADRSAHHLQGAAASLAQTVMGEAVHSGTVVVEVGREASPVAASLAAIRPEAFQLATVAVAVFQVAVVAAAVVDSYGAGIRH